MTPTFEVCVDTAAGLAIAATHADRIELCSALALGGLSPAPGLMAAAQDCRVPVHVLIRPRIGDFAYGAADLAVCHADIAAARAAGLAGVVIGASKDGGLDRAALAEMIKAAGPMAVTLHRVIDVLDDPVAAVDEAVALGFGRILTSGGAVRARDGLPVLAQMQARAAGRIEIMAGSGVGPGDVPVIHAESGILSYHASCGVAVANPARITALNFAGATRQHTDPERVLQMRRAVDALAPDGLAGP